MPKDAVTLAKDTVHNPSEPRHFMRLRPLDKRVVVRCGDTILADTTDALRVLEVGYDVYEPVLYVPAKDTSPDLQQNPAFSHCPLKGDASYFDLKGDPGQTKIAWSYKTPFDFAGPLSGRIAFYADRVSIEEQPL